MIEFVLPETDHLVSLLSVRTRVSEFVRTTSGKYSPRDADASRSQVPDIKQDMTVAPVKSVHGASLLFNPVYGVRVDLDFH